MKNLVLFILIVSTFYVKAQKIVQEKPRILISTDIGGTDPDDNQSMIHLLMYSDKFNIEGLVSSPSFGNGSKEEILKMIDLYEKDLPKLKKHSSGFATPTYLRSVSKQGLRGNAPYEGFSKSTEGSEWIVKSARKKSSQPLWVLVWGGLEDIAQALHDAPDIKKNIKIYWIGGPNKKWSANSYSYIVKNFPDLWFIEVNSTYYSFFSKNDNPKILKSTEYYDQYIKGYGAMGKDFKNYYNGEVKMGDSPTLFYLMHGNPNDPTGESWGGSFEKINRSPRIIVDGTKGSSEDIAFCSLIEFRFKGPILKENPTFAPFYMETLHKKDIQKWPGNYLGNGNYVLQYIPKAAEVLNYKFTSDIPELNGFEGKLNIVNLWPGKENSTDIPLGNTWFSDTSDPNLFDGKYQGGKTISKWKNDILLDWAKRWEWLK
ncbi:nucleoside hydrolase-like domain-containing protein [Chryseobacterium sp. MYb264]|uniref:nucleoside hydrolase-like domain-containing protein n=1 Tax=Chryseobacterium sp. MYb264 TaxID=2745153 RepID=UPI002E1376E1|nr:nucleoside hydrolase-like domain-containing protein [Chryseobacterium sp. MYb264]